MSATTITIPDWVTTLGQSDPNDPYRAEHAYLRLVNARKVAACLRQLPVDLDAFASAFTGSRTFRRRLATQVGLARISPECFATALALLED